MKIMIQDKLTLFAEMTAGATVITPNNRLSNQLIREYYLHQNSTVYDKPLCLPYQAYLKKLFNQVRHQYPHINHPNILSNLQQRHIWREVISSQQDYPCNEGLLHEVQEAWARCQHWQIDIENPAFNHSPQTRQFQQWQRQFQKALTQLNAITDEQLVHHILLYKDTLTTSTLIWVCFDDYTPQQRSLQDAATTRGISQCHYDLPSKETFAYQYAAFDQVDESLQMIDWLKHRLTAGESRIGVVIPDLQTQFRPLQRLLQRHLPHDQFNLSLGLPLTDYPLVTHALTWLRLDKNSITTHQAHLLLHSPFISGAKTEFLARTQTMHTSDVFHENIIPFDQLVDDFDIKTPNLVNLLHALDDYPQTTTPKQWVNLFKNRLTVLGFPGDYPLNSSTYQCFQRFMGLFDELLQLAVINPQISAQGALDALHDIAASTVFQTKKTTPPIQISGLLEASGCTFDSVWVCGLTDQCLPKKTNLSAFIPLDLQRDLEMPHAVTARELQLARQVLQRLHAGSQYSVFSYPRMSGDMPNMPSPLIIESPAYQATELLYKQTQSSLIDHEEDYIYPLQSSETISGGTSLLSKQAMCPFRAFAAHRLHARPEQKTSTGPDASERGKALHRVMELLWQVLGCQKNLNSLPMNELNNHINHAIQSAMAPLISNRRLSFPPLIQEVETARLQRLVKACLEWEKQRLPFEVEALEQTFSLNLADIDFQVRIDRLDKLESNQKWVIDYKTSIPINKPWNEERPESPQLLLYALLDEDINALLFLQLKAGRLTCCGLSENILPIKGVSAVKKNESWADHRGTWHQQLIDLAYEIRAGYCPPQPTRLSTCEHCDFQNICRIRHA